MWIWDIDGTLADLSHRLHFAKVKDWDSFYARVLGDTPISPGVELCSLMLQAGEEVAFVTGRSEVSREDTREWLEAHLGVEAGRCLLLMRPEGDYRPDVKLKGEIADRMLESSYRVMGVFEDRARVVEMWRARGIPCYQVEKGDY